VRVPQSVIGSVAVHAAVLATLGGMVLTRRANRPAPPEAEPPPIEVTLLEPAASAGPGAAPSPAIGGDAPAAIGSGTARFVAHGGRGAGTAPPSGPPGEPGHGTAAGRDLMKMRGPELHGVALSFDPDKHPLPPPVAISGRLHDAGRNMVIPDLVTTVKVDPDGSAHFHDKPDAEIHLQLPIMSRAQLGNMLRKWYEDPYAQTKVGKTQDMAPVDQAVEGTWESGLTGHPDPQGGGTVPVAGGSFDITAWAMRKAHVGDPYQARKLALLDSTRAERAERGGAFRAQQLARSAEIMRGNLEQLWRATSDPIARREALFQLWDECVEDDGAQGEAGERARAQVVGWIRARLPAGAAGAFGAAEIAALDAKRASKQHFRPYE